MTEKKFWDQLRELIDIAIHETRTSADCEGYFFFKGVSVFIINYNHGEVMCTVPEEGASFRVIVENHRPHRIDISGISTAENRKLGFGSYRRNRWRLRENVDACHLAENTFESNEMRSEVFSKEIFPNKEKGVPETIKTMLECSIVHPDSLNNGEEFSGEERIIVDLI